MVHRPDCGTTLAEAADIDFTETDAEMGFHGVQALLYGVCAACGATIGSGVAGAKAGGAGGGAV